MMVVVYGLLLRDVWLLRSLLKLGEEAMSRRRLVRVLLAADLLPVVLMVGYLIDNPPIVMRVSMWVTWLWMVVTALRLSYAFFARYVHRWVGYIAATAAVGILVYGAFWGRCDLRTEQIEYCSNRLPASFDGLRIALFSDLHLGALVDTEKEVSQVVERINKLNPDLVLFGGDLVNIRHSELDERATRLLKGIHAPVYSVIGNHDVGTYIGDSVALPYEVSYRRLVEQQEAMGWCVMQDTTLYLHRGDDSISLSGFAYDPAYKEERHDRDLPMSGTDKGYRGVPKELFNITLIHVPQHWEEILRLGYGDLTLAGHTHAMQLKLRTGRGRGISPARLIYPRWSGRYDAAGRTLYINDGIGYVAYPMRIGARPEVTLITLKRCE